MHLRHLGNKKSAPSNLIAQGERKSVVPPEFPAKPDTHNPITVGAGGVY